MCSVHILLCYIFIVAFGKHRTGPFSFGVAAADSNGTNENSELSCGKNEHNQTWCELTPDRKTDSTFSLCEGEHNWKLKELDLVNYEPWKDLTTEENKLNISNLKLNKTYIISVCSNLSFELGNIVISKPNNSLFSKQNHKLRCSNWTNYTLQMLKNEHIFRIKDSKNVTKDLKMHQSTTLYYLELSTKSNTFWKLQKPTIIEASKNNSKSCVVHIKYTGKLRLTMYVHVQDGCFLNVTATSNRTSNSTMINGHSQLKKTELSFHSDEETNLVIGRKCDNKCTTKACWAIDEIKFLTDDDEHSETDSTANFDEELGNTPVRAENKNFKNLGSSKSIEISSVPNVTEAIQNFTVIPSSEEICLKWEHLYINDLSVKTHNEIKHVRNCNQSCDYKIPVYDDNCTLIVSNSNCESEQVTIEVKIESAPFNLSKNPMVQVCSENNCHLYLPVPDNTTSAGNFNLLVTKVNDTNTNWTVQDLPQQHNYMKIEIGPNKAVSLKNRSYVMCLQDVENNRWYPLVLVLPEDFNYHNITIAVLGLITMIVLAGIFVGYLVFAYFFQKYPFDVLKAGAARRVNLSKEEINQLSEHYKTTGLKTIRKKADLPDKRSELEVLIEPSTSKSVKKPSSNVTSIDVKNFENYLMTSLGDDPYSNDLTRQYRKLQKENVKNRTVGLQNKNVHKNRYKNLIAFDDTRVILKDNGDSEYINANYIDGYENAKAFIATQAPLKSTLADFWCMIWQEKVTSIIMLTELVEDGTVKCEQYWPDLHQRARFGEVLITTVTTKVFSDYIVREFQVSCGSEPRMVHHLQYTTWPDHGVPLYPQNFTPFVKRLLAMPQKDAPIVVHCNAGCGRTGTLILCDIILRMAAKEKTVDFAKVLTKMREQRINLVHNVNQYVFAHVVILECLFGVDFSIPINDSFQDEVWKVLRKTTIKPLMVQLEKVMTQFKKRQFCFTTNMSDEDKNKNRFSQILPGHAQIFLTPSSENPSNYINAVVVDCYRCPKKFIVTQQPLPNTVEDFWTLVKEFEVNTIVSLNEIDGTDPSCPEFWTQSTKTTLQITEEIEDRAYGITKVKISDKSEATTEKTVNVIKMKNWRKEAPYPRNPKDLILVWKETFNSSWKGNSQIVVTCHDGATACGLFVALAHLLEKINYEQSCDVFSAIRTVRQSREEFVQEWGQMEFLYKAAKVYIEEFDNYDNFD